MPHPAFEAEYLDDPSVWYLVAWSNQGTMLMAPIQGPLGYRSYHTAAYSRLSYNENVCVGVCVHKADTWITHYTQRGGPQPLTRPRRARLEEGGILRCKSLICLITKCPKLPQIWLDQTMMMIKG